MFTYKHDAASILCLVIGVVKVLHVGFHAAAASARKCQKLVGRIFEHCRMVFQYSCWCKKCVPCVCVVAVFAVLPEACSPEPRPAPPSGPVSSLIKTTFEDSGNRKHAMVCIDSIDHKVLEALGDFTITQSEQVGHCQLYWTLCCAVSYCSRSVQERLCVFDDAQELRRGSGGTHAQTHLCHHSEAEP